MTIRCWSGNMRGRGTFLILNVRGLKEVKIGMKKLGKCIWWDRSPNIQNQSTRRNIFELVFQEKTWFMMRTQQKYRHHMFYIKDQNLKSLHKDLRHYNVTRYELAPKRHQVIKGSDRLDHTQKFSKKYSAQFWSSRLEKRHYGTLGKIKTSPKSRTN